jgi:hypothetical protein
VWDTNKIQSLFNAETAKAIPAVPIFHEWMRIEMVCIQLRQVKGY